MKVPFASRQILRSPFWMVVAAVALRLAVMGVMYSGPRRATLEQFSFPSEVARIGRSIASGAGFSSPLPVPTGPTAWATPVYPYLVAGIFRVFGVYTVASARAILTLNSLFSALTCLPIFFLARRSFGSRVAIAAGWAWVVFPYAVYIPVHWIWETCLATFLLSVLGLCAIKLEEAPTLRAWMGFGALWGLAALTNASLLTVLPFLGSLLCYRMSRRGLPWARWTGASALAFLLIVAPWFVRNCRTFGRFVPFRSNFGLELRVGNTPETEEPWRSWLHPGESASELQQVRRMGELPYMAEKRREALEFITTHPGTFAWLTVRRIGYVWTGIWSLAPDYLLAKPLEAVNIPLCLALSVLAAAGLRAAFRQRLRGASIYGLILLSTPLLYYITHVNIRYRHPMDPFLVVLTVCAVRPRLVEPRETPSAHKA